MRGLKVKLFIEETKEKIEWCYQDGLEAYLQEALEGFTLLPVSPIVGSRESKSEACNWAFLWLPDGCLLYTSPSPRDKRQSRMPSSA